MFKGRIEKEFLANKNEEPYGKQDENQKRMVSWRPKQDILERYSQECQRGRQAKRRTKKVFTCRRWVEKVLEEM